MSASSTTPSATTPTPSTPTTTPTTVAPAVVAATLTNPSPKKKVSWSHPKLNVAMELVLLQWTTLQLGKKIIYLFFLIVILTTTKPVMKNNEQLSKDRLFTTYDKLSTISFWTFVNSVRNRSKKARWNLN